MHETSVFGFSLGHCCPPGTAQAFNLTGRWRCYFHERDFTEEAGPNLGRWVDPSKPPVWADCVKFSLNNQFQLGPPLVNIPQSGVGGSEPPGGTIIPGFITDILDIGSQALDLAQDFGLFNGNGGATNGAPVTIGGPCEVGFRRDPTTGLCEFIGSPADISTGKESKTQLTPFGLSVNPITVGSIRGNPIRRCPRGLVLGKDDRCYHTGKGGIHNSQRKWPRPTRPTVSALDAKLMRKYGAQGTKRDSIKRLAQDAGFSCKNK